MRSSSHKVPSFGRQGNDFSRNNGGRCCSATGWSFSLRWISQQNRSISDMIKNSCTFSFLAWSVAFFAMPWLPVTVSILLSSLTGRDRSHRGKGGEGRSCMCFSPLWHLPHCCMTVINRGALPQGQPGAAGTIGVKGQKVSDIGGRHSTQCLGLSVLHRVCSQREGQVEETQFKLCYYLPKFLPFFLPNFM